MYSWSQEKLIAFFSFLAATIISYEEKIAILPLLFTSTPITELLDTIIKGIINSIFAINVVVATHYIKKYLNKKKL